MVFSAGGFRSLCRCMGSFPCLHRPRVQALASNNSSNGIDKESSKMRSGYLLLYLNPCIYLCGQAILSWFWTSDVWLWYFDSVLPNRQTIWQKWPDVAAFTSLACPYCYNKTFQDPLQTLQKEHRKDPKTRYVMFISRDL